MLDHVIERLDHLQVLSRLTSGLLAALLLQALGLASEAIRRGRQMAIAAVFRQAGLQVFDLRRKQGNLLALPLEHPLRAYLLLQATLVCRNSCSSSGIIAVL